MVAWVFISMGDGGKRARQWRDRKRECVRDRLLQREREMASAIK